MAMRVIYFFQEGCMACQEQEPILAEAERTCGFSAERINPLRERESIKKYHLSVTPTILLFSDGVEIGRFEGLVHREQLEDALRRRS